jgi:hypothetical protein
MKRFLMILILAAGMMSSYAINYNDARNEAWFLTDKMAYELDLNANQYDCVYQVNLDYFLSINKVTDIDGIYWQFRDADLRCILSTWQYNLYNRIEYFVFPIRWIRANWYYPAYDYYRRGYYYFSMPKIYMDYRGVGFSHRHVGDRSPHYGFAPGGGRGMRTAYGASHPKDHYGNPGNAHRPDSNGHHNGNMGGGRSFNGNHDHNDKGHSANPGGGRNFNDNNRNGGGNNPGNNNNNPGMSHGNPGNNNNNSGIGRGNGGNNNNNSGMGRDNGGNKPSNNRNFGNSNQSTRSSQSSPSGNANNSGSGRRTFGR